MTAPASDDLIAAAELGTEAKEFLAGNLGRYVIGAAQQHVQQAQIDLGGVDPDDRKAIVALQDEIKLGTRFEAWLRELVHEGETAMNIYIQERNQ